MVQWTYTLMSKKLIKIHHSSQKLIVSLRTAIVSDDWKLDKQQTSHDDTRTEVLPAALLSLTMRFGNLWHHTEMLSTKLAFGLDYPTILTAPSYLHICSGRLRFLGSLKIESVWHISAVLALIRCKF